MSFANYLIDKTSLMQIKYDLQKAAMYGDNTPIGLLKVDNATGAYVSLIEGGLLNGWRARKVDGVPNRRLFDLLLIGQVTPQICQRTSALQVNGVVFTKTDQTPWDGSTPAQWTFEAAYNGTDSSIAL
jgi:hypothetical protein